MISAHLSKELRAQYKRRSLGVRKGDEIKVLKGKHRGKVGTIEEVDTKNSALLISGIKVKRTVGTEKSLPIKPSEIVVTNLNLADSMRQKILLRKVKEVKIVQKEEPAPKAETEKEKKATEKEETEVKEDAPKKDTGTKVLADAPKGKKVGSSAKTRSAQKA